MDTPSQSLEGGHEKRVLGVRWHPHVNGLAASHCGGKLITIWDVQRATHTLQISAAPQLLQSMELRDSSVLSFAKDKVTGVLFSLSPPFPFLQ